MNQPLLDDLQNAVANDLPVSKDVARAIVAADVADMPVILAAADAVRRRRFGNTAHLCSILNAKSGACGEDCAFCAQSAHHCTDADSFAMRSLPQIQQAYEQSAALPIGHFGVVTSGGALSGSDFETICEAVRTKSRESTHWCASLGCLDREQLAELKRNGLKRFHHNLETSESFFPSICTTHTYAERLETVRAVKDVGLELCCGGIMGLGESLEQRVEFALALQSERVDAIPLNFLVPIPGTRLADRPPMKPWEILRAIAMVRLVNPTAEVKVCAGRLLLRDLQSMIFHAGATGMMVGPLLTVAGRDVDTDLQMLEDLEMDYAL
ncbi:MAG: biotin synthase BioB [Lentisphaeria bacterium]|nr:biotin synthase BioB [Lentisphaeria bacterium]